MSAVSAMKRTPQKTTCRAVAAAAARARRSESPTTSATATTASRW